MEVIKESNTKLSTRLKEYKTKNLDLEELNNQLQTDADSAKSAAEVRKHFSLKKNSVHSVRFSHSLLRPASPEPLTSPRRPWRS